MNYVDICFTLPLATILVALKINNRFYSQQGRFECMFVRSCVQTTEITNVRTVLNGVRPNGSR